MPSKSSNSAQMKWAEALDRFIQGFGQLVSYLCALLVVVIVGQVLARYVFGRGFVMLEELEWHLYAVGFLVGISYCAVRDGNVRMDLLYRNYSTRTKAWLELFSVVALLMPFVVIMLIHSWEFFYQSWSIGERSNAPLGLPCRWAMKGFLPLAILLLGLAGVVRFFKAIALLRGEDSNGSN